MKLEIFKLFIVFQVTAFLFQGCGFKKAQLPKLEIIKPIKQQTIFTRINKNIIRNKNLKLEYFISKYKNENSIKNYLKFQKHFMGKYFKPWNIKNFSYEKKYSMWGIRILRKKRFYGENLKLMDKKNLKKIIQNCNFEEFNKVKKRAITITNSSIMVYPSHKIFLKNSTDYPFDFNQNSLAKANQALFISHFSKDGAWVFVQSSTTFGWLSIKDIAFVDDEFIRKFKTKKMLVITKEKTPIYNNFNNFLFNAKVASIFPLVKSNENYYEVLQSYKGEDFNAKLTTIKIPKSYGDFHPLKFNQKNISIILNELLDEKYGWGGMLENRDCSSMTQDFFLPFGVWLPRNSKAQSHYLKYINIYGLTPTQKERKIIEIAKPFESILYIRGHIMLYIGHFEGRVFVMHNTWGGGVKFKNPKQKIIYGKSLISTLYLGNDLNDVKSYLINKVRGVGLLIPDLLDFE